VIASSTTSTSKGKKRERWKSKSTVEIKNSKKEAGPGED
jgi:hypothetical protein